MRRILAFICIIFVMVCFIVLQVIKIPLPDYTEWEWEQISIVGKVVGKERRFSERGETLVVTILPLKETESIQMKEKAPHTEGKILCYITDLAQEPLMGSVVKVRGKLKSFERLTNPGQFCAAKFYQISKIDFRLYQAEIIARTAEFSHYHEALYRLKRTLGETLDAYFPEQNAKTLRAMLLGERGQTDAEIKTLFQRNGIIHILTISGLHISIIGMGLYKLLRRAYMPIIIAAAVSMAVMISYGIMTNMSASSFRAIFMFGLRMAARLMKRTYDLLTALAVAAVLLLIEQPLFLFHSGFLFSFLAVLTIGLFVPVMKYQDESDLKKRKDKPPPSLTRRRRRWLRLRYRFPHLKYIEAYLKRLSPLTKIKDSLLTCLMISVFTLPIYFLFYYEFPLYSVFLNLIVIPPMTLVMISGILTMTVGYLSEPLGKIAAAVANTILDFYEWACRISDHLPYNNLIIGRPESWQVMIYCAFILFILACHKKIKMILRYVILVFAILMLLIRTPIDLTITFLDVGQGEAIFIATPDRRYYFIDGGSSTVSGVGEYRVLPFLKSQGVSRLDGWFITHPHADHYSAFPELAAKINQGGVRIDNLILPDINQESKCEEYKELERVAGEAGITLQYISRGQCIAADKKEEIMIYCLNPIAGSAWAVKDANAYSSAMYLAYGAFSILLTGDIEKTGEEEMMKYITDQAIASDLTILKVAHHGSNNSTDEAFLSFTMPSYSVISAGRGNSYGHPHRELLSRLADAGTEVYITYESGAVTIRTNGKSMQVEEFLTSPSSLKHLSVPAH